jgi:hypothetical protein
MPRRPSGRKKPPTNPLSELADAIDTAAETVRDRPNEGDLSSAAPGAPRKSPVGYVYAGSYVLTYGVMFPALMIARGVADGARTARAKAEKRL